MTDVSSCAARTTMTDMSSRAVTLRLVRTSQLRRLCLALRRSQPRPRAPNTAQQRRR
jgi:hypothetical protein